MSRTWQEQVPHEYHKYGQVFSEEESQRFPGPRPWDHAIDLVPDAPPTLDCKTYPLAHGQQELLDQFINKHLKKGYIRDSSSPYVSPDGTPTRLQGSDSRPLARRSREWTRREGRQLILCP